MHSAYASSLPPPPPAFINHLFSSTISQVSLSSSGAIHSCPGRAARCVRYKPQTFSLIDADPLRPLRPVAGLHFLASCIAIRMLGVRLFVWRQISLKATTPENIVLLLFFFLIDYYQLSLLSLLGDPKLV